MPRRPTPTQRHSDEVLLDLDARPPNPAATPPAPAPPAPAAHSSRRSRTLVFAVAGLLAAGAVAGTTYVVLDSDSAPATTRVDIPVSEAKRDEAGAQLMRSEAQRDAAAALRRSG